jgi:two-component system OmpR family response regulator
MFNKPPKIGALMERGRAVWHACEWSEMLAEQNSRDPEPSRPETPATPAKHILVVDDDPAMRDMLTGYLANQNFRVSAVEDGEAMSHVLRDDAVDLIILDMKLAHEDGLDLMRRLGTPPDAPIIVVTGHRRDEADRIVGLELGADDYMTKPFSLRELLARIRAVLRRSEAAHRPARGKARQIRYRFAGWELNTRTRRLRSPIGEVLPLTAGEFNLLTAFLRSPQQVLSREQLLAASRVHDEEVFDRSIDVQILRLRRKLEPNPSEPRLITTERGAGYMLATPVALL